MSNTSKAAQTAGVGNIPRVIAIDGPAASGKSTVGFALAQRLHYLYFDTGAMYRAVTWAAMQQKLDLADREAVGALAESLAIDILPPQSDHTDGRQTTVLVQHEDVTWAIRSTDVDRHVSIVAANPLVRSTLTRYQRRISERFRRATADMAGLVMVGRDIGTIVLPDAPLKIYLDAPVEERAQRRYQELRKRGKSVTYEEVLADMRHRDHTDTQREIAPLRPADDAHVLDTTGCTPPMVVDRILTLIQQTGVPGDTERRSSSNLQ